MPPPNTGAVAAGVDKANGFFDGVTAVMAAGVPKPGPTKPREAVFQKYNKKRIPHQNTVYMLNIVAAQDKIAKLRRRYYLDK